jgi:hypothetical protein
MKLYKKYLEEKYDRKIIEDKDGFIEYKKFSDGSVYIYTLFVSKDSRNHGLGHGLELQMIAKESPTLIFCDIDLNSYGAEIALSQIIKKAKYKIHKTEHDKIILFKEVR